MVEDTIPKTPILSKWSQGPWIIALVVVLVGVTAFGLGRLSALEEQKGSLKIYAPDQSAAVGGAARVLASPVAAPSNPLPAADQPKNFVASKSGTKYYAASCSGAARIKEENKIWFGSVEQAQAAGYSAAANCAGI